MAGIPFNNLSSNITIDLSSGSGGSHVVMAVAIPENEEISSSNTTTTNVHFVNIARKIKKGVALAIMISIIVALAIMISIIIMIIGGGSLGVLDSSADGRPTDHGSNPNGGRFVNVLSISAHLLRNEMMITSETRGHTAWEGTTRL